jgi:hypothetical protein
VKLQDQAINHASVEEFLQAMAPHCGRLEHLEISDGARWTLLSDFRDPLPALRALTIRTHSPDYPHQYQSYPPAVAPLLRKVSISYYNTAYTSILPWSQLTVVDLGHISLRECVHLVPRLVNVVYCRVSIMYCIHGEEMRSGVLSSRHNHSVSQKAKQIPAGISAAFGNIGLRRLFLQKKFGHIDGPISAMASTPEAVTGLRV